jgi:TonB family protein
MTGSRPKAQQRRTELSLQFLLAASVSSQLHAEPVQLSNGPSAKWELVQQDGDRNCLLRSKLNGSTTLDTVEFTRSIGGRDLDLRIHGPSTGKPWTQFNSTYTVGGGQEKSRQLTEDDGDNGRRSVSIDFDSDEAAALVRGAQLSLSIDNERSITIDTRGIGALLPAIEQCSRDRLVRLGADPVLVSKIAVEPYAEDSALFSSDDYPVEALRKEQQGTATVLLAVSKNGHVKSCRVAESSKVEVLDRATCNTLKRGRFEPAKDFAGRAIASPKDVKVRWVLPTPSAIPVEFASFRYVFPVDEDRQIANCRVEGDSDRAGPDGSCLIMLGQVRWLVSTAPKEVPLAGQDIVMATEYVVGPSDAPSRLGLGKGEAMLGRSITRLSIDTSGKARSCTAESIGSFQSVGEKAFCDDALQQPYEALPDNVPNQSERQMTIIRALYLHRH